MQVGDAASTPRPHIGFGVSKAGAEAQALAEALSNYDDIDRALTAYNSVRHPLSERIVAQQDAVSWRDCSLIAVVHHSKIGCSMSAVGHSLPMRLLPRLARCPEYPESRH
jgi:2-polyprenyl-6-methoxyphenol hydroxylase-like FAD-dependent oxidoreductase